MRAGFSAEVRARCRQIPPQIEEIVEAVAPGAEASASRFSEWAQADSLTGLTNLLAGGVAIVPSVSVLIENTTQDATNNITDLDGPFGIEGAAPFDVAKVTWAAAGHRITSIDVYLDPNVSGGVQNVVQWALQVWQLVEVSGDPTPLGSSGFPYRLAPISNVVRVTAGASAGEVTFSFNTQSPVRVGSPPINGEAVNLHFPVTYVAVWAMDADGANVTNAAWNTDDGGADVTTGGHTLEPMRLLMQDGYFFEDAPNAPELPYISINTGSYSETTITFTSNPFDLGAVPTNTVRMIGHSVTPPGTSVTFRVRNDADTAWVEFNPYDSTDDLAGVGLRQSYDMQVVLTPDAAGLDTPILRRLGVIELVGFLATQTVRLSGGDQKIDPIKLRAETTPLRIAYIQDGERDFFDTGSYLARTYYPRQLEFWVWWGHADLDRSQWGLSEIWLCQSIEVDTRGATVFGCDTPLQEVRGVEKVLPVSSGSPLTRVPFVQTNQATDDIWDAIVAAVELEDRFRGNRPEGVTQQQTNTVTDSDALEELDAVCFNIGYGNLSRQGRVEAVDFYGGTDIKHLFYREQVHYLGVSPGHDQRLPLYNVPYAWDDADREYGGEVQRFHGPALLAFRGIGRLAESRLDDLRNRWVTTQAHASAIAERMVNAFGAGLIYWQFLNTEGPMPWMELGDQVGMDTNLFLARDPNADRALFGNIWAIGRIVEMDRRGERFGAWVQSYADIIPEEADVSRNLSVPVTIRYGAIQMQPDDETQQFVRSNGYVSASVGTNQTFTLSVPRPVGAVGIRDVRARCRWEDPVSDFVQCGFREIGETGTLTTIEGSLAPGQGNSWQTVSSVVDSGGFDNDPSSPLARQYQFDCELASGTTDGAAFLWAEVDWEILVRRGG